MSEEPPPENENIDSEKKDIPRGAACLEIIVESSDFQGLETHNETLVSDIEEINILPLPPQTSPTFQTMLHDLHQSSRRNSTFLSPNNIYNFQSWRNRRHDSLPTFSINNDRNFNNDFDFKKLMLDSSRRSSLESAYHSQRSDSISRTDNISGMEYYGDSNNLIEGNYYPSQSSFMTEEEVERQIIERRNSLSYEAIRNYFLECNPYIREIEQLNHCFDHNQLNGNISPNCRRRRSSIVLQFPQFRTRAHQAVIERQFEDLSNIPDANRSRSTSIDIFGGIGFQLYSQQENEQTNEALEDDTSFERKLTENENLEQKDDNKRIKKDFDND